jgi:hypothetical protein
MGSIYTDEAEALVWATLIEKIEAGASLDSQLWEVKETYGSKMRDKMDARIVRILVRVESGKVEETQEWALRPENERGLHLAPPEPPRPAEPSRRN